MIIKIFFEFLFSMIENLLDALPQFPTLELFSNTDVSEFSSVFTSVSNVLGYFLPCGTIVAIIGVELAINNYRLLSAGYYRLKHMIPFV